jgi:hypothetical protein
VVLAVIMQARFLARGPLGGTGGTLAFADTFWWMLGLCVVAALGVARLQRRTAIKIAG